METKKSPEELRVAVLEHLQKARFHSSLPIPGLRYAPPDYLEYLTTYDSGSPLVPLKMAERKIFFMGQELTGEDALGFAFMTTFIDPRRLLKYLENRMILGERDGNILLVGRISLLEVFHKVADELNITWTEEGAKALMCMPEVDQGHDLEFIFELGRENQLVAMSIDNRLVANGEEFLAKAEFWYET